MSLRVLLDREPARLRVVDPVNPLEAVGAACEVSREISANLSQARERRSPWDVRFAASRRRRRGSHELVRIVGKGRELAPRRKVKIARELQLEGVRVASRGSRPCVQHVAYFSDLRLAQLEIVHSHHRQPLLDRVPFSQQDLDHLDTPGDDAS